MKNKNLKITVSPFLLSLIFASMLTVFMAMPHPSLADLRLCNQTDSNISVAVGYKSENGWRTEGWWNFNPREDQNACKVLLPGTLAARFYYVYALDITQGGEWGGEAILCTHQKEFTIDGVENCVTRGYEKTGFFEVDTKNQASWTIQLADPEQEGQ